MRLFSLESAKIFGISLFLSIANIGAISIFITRYIRLSNLDVVLVSLGASLLVVVACCVLDKRKAKHPSNVVEFKARD